MKNKSNKFDTMQFWLKSLFFYIHLNFGMQNGIHGISYSLVFTHAPWYSILLSMLSCTMVFYTPYSIFTLALWYSMFLNIYSLLYDIPYSLVCTFALWYSILLNMYSLLYGITYCLLFTLLLHCILYSFMYSLLFDQSQNIK